MKFRWKFRGLLLSVAMLTEVGAAQSLHCDLQSYKAMDGLRAEVTGSALSMTWQGEGGQQLRAQFALRNGQPVVAELAARQGTGSWILLGKNLTPDFQVTTGRRRISGAQRNQLKKLNLDTPEQEAISKWDTFWDAPLVIPGGGDIQIYPARNPKLPVGRLAISRATVLWSAAERGRASRLTA